MSGNANLNHGIFLSPHPPHVIYGDGNVEGGFGIKTKVLQRDETRDW